MLVSGNLVPTYFLASSSTILVFDYFLTVRLEVEHIWLSPFNWITVLYLVQRYLPFVDTFGVLLYGVFFPTVSSQKCSVINHFVHGLHLFGITLSEVVLTARVYAACKLRFSSRALWKTLAIVFAIFWIPIYITTEITPQKTSPFGNVGHDVTMSGIETLSGDSLWPSTTCIMHSHSPEPLLYLAFVFAGAYGTVLLIMIIIAGYPIYKVQGYSQVFRVVYSEAIMFSIIFIAITIANEVVILTSPEIYASLLMPLTRIIHVTLTSRTVLNIREAMTRSNVLGSNNSRTFTDMDVGEWEMSTVNFVSESRYEPTSDR
ncbi:hypothetical protein L218DRAFT_718685 [Marasmius fiardii PR-910]|nr:hypothetical protein L218DRAFT_718685 [Marasmius fiardii PR-910]